MTRSAPGLSTYPASVRPRRWISSSWSTYSVRARSNARWSAGFLWPPELQRSIGEGDRARREQVLEQVGPLRRVAPKRQIAFRYQAVSAYTQQISKQQLGFRADRWGGAGARDENHGACIDETKEDLFVPVRERSAIRPLRAVQAVGRLAGWGNLRLSPASKGAAQRRPASDAAAASTRAASVVRRVGCLLQQKQRGFPCSQVGRLRGGHARSEFADAV